MLRPSALVCLTYILLGFVITLPVLVLAYDPVAEEDCIGDQTIFNCDGTPRAATSCPISGTRPATANDAAVKEGFIHVGQCYDPNDPTIGQNFAQAKQTLAGMICSRGVNTAQLDAKFAVCASQFMEKLRKASPGACIRSGFRSSAEQADACRNICGQLSCPGKCAPPGRSYHQKGLAIDVNYHTSNQIAWQLAAGVGIVNPGGLHRSDPNHFQAANFNCAGVAVPSGDEGDYYNDTGHFYGQSGLPFDNSLRQALGMPPPPPPPMQSQPLQSLTQPQQTPATQTQLTPSSTPPLGTLNTTPYPAGTCMPQTYCSQQNGNIYYRATTCVDQKYLACQYGCTGIVCNASSTASNAQPSGGSGGGQSANGSGSGSSSGTSTFDLIDFFASQPTLSAATVGTATPIDITGLIQNTDNASVLNPTTTLPQNPPIQTPPQGSPSFGPFPQQTFTSNDLANTPIVGGFAQGSFPQQVLAQMKATLTAMLFYLRPFGAIPSQATLIE